MSTEEKKEKSSDAGRIIFIVAVVTVVLGLFVMSRPKHRTINLAGPQPKKAAKKTPAGQAAPAADPSAIFDDGIVSFEMHPAPSKAKAEDAGSSREARVRKLMDGVSGIGDDLEAKNALVTRISSLNFKLTGTEFLEVLAQASIDDDFYYASAVKSVATSLQYPLTQKEFEGIVAGVTDMSLKFKLRTILGREQERHAAP